jgi:short-subunit dehydrogenase
VKNIVITGCSSGIGLETATFLKAQGIKVYATARKEHDVGVLNSFGFHDALLLDVTKPKQIERVIQSVVESDGKIDCWFNNAGFGQAGFLEDITTQTLKEQFETNVFGLHECTLQVLEVMRKQGYGKIIQHSSVLGLVSLPARGAYNASKYAIEGLTDTLRLEYRHENIYFSLLNTGPITSKFRETALQKLEEHVDIENSRFKEEYKARLTGENPKVPFNEEATSVAKVVYKIMKAKKPKPRYYITRATDILGFAKRLLPTGLLDRLLLKVG